MVSGYLLSYGKGRSPGFPRQVRGFLDVLSTTLSCQWERGSFERDVLAAALRHRLPECRPNRVSSGSSQDPHDDAKIRVSTVCEQGVDGVQREISAG